MSAIARRTFISLASGAVAVPFVSLRTNATEAKSALVVYDSRIAASRRFAAKADRVFDIANEDAVHWRNARAQLAILAKDGVTGVTRWSDWVNLRGLLAERGLRVTGETHLANGIFAWTMQRRS